MPYTPPGEEPAKFRQVSPPAIIIKPPVHKYGKKKAYASAIFARVYQAGSRYAPLRISYTKFLFSGSA